MIRLIFHPQMTPFYCYEIFRFRKKNFRPGDAKNLSTLNVIGHIIKAVML